MDANAESEDIADAAKWKEFASTLPPLCFSAAKQTTELVLQLGLVEGGEGNDDDSR